MKGCFENTAQHAHNKVPEIEIFRLLVVVLRVVGYVG